MINLCKIATSRGLHRNQHEEVNWRLAVDSSLLKCPHLLYQSQCESSVATVFPLVRARLRPAITLQLLDG
jgi:hypothetical protein